MATHEIQALDAFLAEARRGVDEAFSAVLYGSAARGEYLEACSDLNVLMILESIDTDVLTRLKPALDLWRTSHNAVPLLVTREEWERAVDVFPIEIVDIQHAYEVLHGDDPVAGLVVDRRLLRLGLESELRGKLLRLRQAYAVEAQNPGALGTVATESLRMVLVLFRGMLALAGLPIPGKADAVVAAAARLAGFEPEPIRDIIAHRADREWQCPPTQFAAYLGAIEQSVQFVDTYDSGVQQ